MKRLFSAVTLLSLSLLFASGPARADIMIDLNDFYFYPDDPVTIPDDGSSATIGEGDGITPVLLANDPYLGDPEVIFAEIGGVRQVLSFDYDFVEPAGNDDEFGAILFDTEFGPFLGALSEFYVDHTDSGKVSIDLSPFTGQTLGLQFELNALFTDSGYDSTVTVSNVKLSPVPVPAAVLLAGLGMGTSVGILRKRRKQSR